MVKIKLKDKTVKVNVKTDCTFGERMEAIRSAAELCFSRDDDGKIEAYRPYMIELVFALCLLALYTDIDCDTLSLDDLWVFSNDAIGISNIASKLPERVDRLYNDLCVIVDAMHDSVKKETAWDALAKELRVVVQKINEDFHGVDAETLGKVTDKLLGMSEMDIVDTILEIKNESAGDDAK